MKKKITLFVYSFDSISLYRTLTKKLENRLNIPLCVGLFWLLRFLSFGFTEAIYHDTQEIDGPVG